MFLSYSHSPRLRSSRKRRADRRGIAIACRRRRETERRHQGARIRRRPEVRAPGRAGLALRRRPAPAWIPALRTRRRRHHPVAEPPIPGRLPGGRLLAERLGLVRRCRCDRIRIDRLRRGRRRRHRCGWVQEWSGRVRWSGWIWRRRRQMKGGRGVKSQLAKRDGRGTTARRAR